MSFHQVLIKIKQFLEIINNFFLENKKRSVLMQSLVLNS